MSSAADAVRAELDRRHPLPETAHLPRVLSPAAIAHVEPAVTSEVLRRVTDHQGEDRVRMPGVGVGQAPGTPRTPVSYDGTPPSRGGAHAQ